jgi:hypothetical protein
LRKKYIMKKSIALLGMALLVFTSVLITGCKKGEDDPFISLKSRDARITAKWKLTKAEGTSTNTFAGTTYTTTSNFNGTVYTITYSSGDVDSYSYALEMEILKGGEMTSTETEDGEITTSKDVWFWTNNTSDKTGLYLGGLDEVIFNVQGLSSKELILNINNEESQTADGQTTTSKSSTTWTFEKGRLIELIIYLKAAKYLYLAAFFI